MGMFDKIGEAAIGQGGNYLNSGHIYLVEVQRVMVKTGRKGDVFTIVEMVIHESDDTKNPPGFKASWTCNMKHDASLGNIAWFFGACMGIPVEDQERLKREITGQFAEYAVSPQNPLKGKMVEVEVHEVTTKAGTPFSKHHWKPTTKAANPAVSASASQAQSALSAFGAPPTTPASPVPATPAAPPPPPLPAVFPPAGWFAHPTSPGWFHNGVEVLTEQQLRARS